MGERHEGEEPSEEAGVVDVALHYEHAAGLQHRLSRLLQRRVVVIVEVVKPDHAVAAPAEGEGDVSPDEAGGAGDEHGHASGAAGGGRFPDLLLPLHSAPRGVEISGGAVDEALEAEVGGRERDQEQRPQEHGAGRGEAAVELAIDGVRPLDLHLPRRRWKQLIFHRSHLLLLLCLFLFQSRMYSGVRRNVLLHLPKDWAQGKI
ncbi:unnamed protein product [Musa acuminata var. zebrina]